MNCILWTTETANIDISLYKNYKDNSNGAPCLMVFTANDLGVVKSCKYSSQLSPLT